MNGQGGTVVGIFGTIIDDKRGGRAEEANVPHPVVDSVGGVQVNLLFSVSVQTGGDVEKTSVGDGVLIVVTGVPGENLPSQTASTRGGVPTVVHGVEDSLDQIKPRLVSVGKVSLDGLHDSHTPHTLIIITLRHTLVGRHVVVVGTSLLVHGIEEKVGECGIVLLTEVPVVNPASEHLTGVPPVVGRREHTDGTAVSNTHVVVHFTCKDGRGGITDGVLGGHIK